MGAVEKAVAEVQAMSEICKQVERSATEVLKAAENVSSASQQLSAAGTVVTRRSRKH